MYHLISIPSFKKTLADLLSIKALRQKEKFWFVRQTWLAKNLVFSIFPPFFDNLPDLTDIISI